MLVGTVTYTPTARDNIKFIIVCLFIVLLSSSVVESSLYVPCTATLYSSTIGTYCIIVWVPYSVHTRTYIVPYGTVPTLPGLRPRVADPVHFRPDPDPTATNQESIQTSKFFQIKHISSDI